MPDYLDIHRLFDRPYDSFDNSMLGPAFADELATVSRLWFACGYRPGVAAYLNFFLLREFNVTHDRAFPARFASFRSMADSFYRTDVFIRDVTDSGPQPTGGISSTAVRAALTNIMQRHRKLAIPEWMMTYFGFSLVEGVEKVAAANGGLSKSDCRLHLAYMTTAFRIMGIAFSEDREVMQRFARLIERDHAGLSPHAEQHARHIFVLGEMIGVSSKLDQIGPMLPERTRAVLAEIYERVRPNPIRRHAARLLGRLLMKRAIGSQRQAVPVAD